jgi:diguanylate cyclase (GGDEF)-like protein/PAS domain S-box-containing protein
MTSDEAGGAGAFTADQVRHMVDTAVNPFVVIDAEGTALWASASVVELLGVPADDLVGRSMIDFVSPSSLEAATHALANAVSEDRSPGAVPAEWEGVGPVLDLVRADGTTITCSIAVATPARTGLAGFVLQLRRADPSHALEQALLAMGSDRPLGDVLDGVAAVLRGELPAADVVILHGDPHLGGAMVPAADHGRLLDGIDLPQVAPEAWSKAAAAPGEVFELSADDLPAPLQDLARRQQLHWVALLATPPVLAADPSSMAMVTLWSRSPFRMHFLNHERIQRCGELMSMALRWEFGRRALRWAATHDGLTGLHNRAAFLRELHAAGGSRRRSTDRTVVLYLDLDDFKPVNDQHGHTLGDSVLVEVAARLRAVVRPTDLVARLGGDEFAVLCPGVEHLADAEQLAHRLVAEVSLPMEVAGVEVHVGLSVGIAALEDDEDVERVLSRADDALRAAKRDGKAGWQLA